MGPPSYRLRCGICGAGDTEATAVCDDCDERAVHRHGDPARHGSTSLDRDLDSDAGIAVDPDTGDNPAFIDGQKCWRRYRFGGWVTMVDDHGPESLEEFYRAHGLS